MQELITHLIATIRYRFNYSISKANKDYPQLSIGSNVRTPIQIVHHMRGLMYYAMKMITNERTPMDDISTWEEELRLFHQSIDQLNALCSFEKVSKDQCLRMMQGPLADALTHIGQLAMLSRVNGHSLEKENFVHAPISGE